MTNRKVKIIINNVSYTGSVRIDEEGNIYCMYAFLRYGSDCSFPKLVRGELKNLFGFEVTHDANCYWYGVNGAKLIFKDDPEHEQAQLKVLIKKTIKDDGETEYDLNYLTKNNKFSLKRELCSDLKN